MVNKRKFIPEGVEDVNAVEYEKKEWMQTKAKEIFRSFGYHQILTPTFEYYDLFSEIESAINLDEMYKLIDRNGKILVLRPDATIPVARMAATKYGSIDGYLKFMYFTSVYRSSDFRAGGKREFTQAGIEYLGNEEPEADAEVIATAIKSLQNLNFSNIHIDIGQADYFKGLMSELDVSQQDKNKIRILIENKNLADLDNTLEELTISEASKTLLTNMPFLYGEIDEVINKARSLAINDTMKKAVDNT
ncbi:MAG: ATP phosphoribosyltransferase regulatory subunit, partial [Clostridia bacterium]|nr:ATP phosphoribosyltransferase regulatory subunit [Clostridia bacterium]